MNSKVTLDRAGRVVLPKALRDEMHLSPGDTLDLTVKGDEVILRPRRGATPLQNERGVWVFQNRSLKMAFTASKFKNRKG